MAFIDEILKKIKGATLDKTDIDERIGSAVQGAAKQVGNFVTQTLPNFASQADSYLNKPTFFQDLTSPTSLSGKKTIQGPIERFVVQPTAKILDAGTGSAYRVYKEQSGINNVLRRMEQLRNDAQKKGIKIQETPRISSQGPSASDLVNVASVVAGVPKVGANIVGGAIGSGFKAVENIASKKPIFQDTGRAYDEGYQFTAKLGPVEAVTGAIAKPVIQVLGNKLPVVQKIISKLTPEEGKQFGTFLEKALGFAKNTAKKANISGLSMSVYGALDSANPEEALRNAWEQYKMGAMFRAGSETVGIAAKPLASVLGRGSKKLSELFSKSEAKAEPKIEPIVAELKTEVPNKTSYIDDPINNELYDEMRAAQSKLMEKIDTLKGYKSDSEIPPKIMAELESLKADWNQKAKVWKDAYPTKNRSAEFIYTPAENLSPEMRDIETRFGSEISSNRDSSIAEYKKRFGNVLNTDNARELSKDYSASNETRSRYSAAVHEPASQLVKDIYAKELATPDPKGMNKVVITAGGTGAGKTTAIKDVPEAQNLINEAQIVYDTNSNSFESAKSKIDQAIKAGKEVSLLYVHRDPIEAMVNGAVPRAKRMGRTVPLEEHLNTHVGALETVKKLKAEYADNPNVDIQIINNSYGKGNAKLESIDTLNKVMYNKDELRGVISSELDKLYGQGQISDPIYEGFTGKKGVAQRMVSQNGAGSSATPQQNYEPGTGQVKRGFASTVEGNFGTPEQVAKNVAGAKESFYTPTTNKETVARVTSDILSKGDDFALSVAKNEKNPDANATAMLLIDKYLKGNEFEKATDLIKQVQPRFTKQGQQIQILSLYGRLTPTGAVKFAQKVINDANKNLLPGKKIELTKEMVNIISGQAERIQSFPEGSRERIVAIARLMDTIAGQVPSSVAQKVSTIQTMAQLLNLKTAIRNLGGNALFAVGENVSDVVGAGVDRALSTITGKRTKVLPNIRTQLSGAKKGFQMGLEDALLGIDTGRTGTQFELPNKTFRGGVMGGLEKALNIELRAPDRAFYTAAYEGSLNNQMRAAGVDKATPQMEEIAHSDALYRTFQDNNIATKAFSGIKKALNVGKEFGLGDIVLKYPKTPASLLMRGVDYSPAGFAKTIYEAAQPLMGKEFNQKAFVESFSRALVGTAGLINTGIILHKLGIITGRPEKDKDIAAIQRTMGLGGYKINVSALKRFALSGMNPESAKRQNGDTLVSYDWVQPFAIGVSMGANIDDSNGKVNSGVATLLSSLEGGVETLAEQPLVKGVRQLFQGYSPVQAFVDTVQGIPSSFVPQIVNQTNQLVDNTSRETTDQNPIIESMNQVKARIPGFAQTLPKRYDVLGNEMERYQGGTNSFLNVFANPAFVSIVNENPSAKEVVDIFERSGETQQAPRVVAKKIKINGENKELTADEIGKYQEYVGKKANSAISTFSNDPLYQEKSDPEKAKFIASILSDINTAAKIELFGDSPKTVDKGVKIALSGAYDRGIDRGVGGVMTSLTKEGNLKVINLDEEITPPKLTGNSKLDKKLISKYKGALTTRENDIVDLYNAGKIDKDQAEKMLNEIEALRGSISGSGSKSQLKLLKDIISFTQNDLKARQSLRESMINKSSGTSFTRKIQSLPKTKKTSSLYEIINNKRKNKPLPMPK